MDLRRQIVIVRKWLPLLIAIVVLAAVAAFAASGLLPKSYEARATLIVGQSLTAANPDYNQLLVSQRLSTTYASIATTRPLLQNVIAGLHLDATADQLARHVRAEGSLDSTLLTVTADDPDPGRAAAIANALAEQLIAASPAIQGREQAFEAFVATELAATQVQIEAAQARFAALMGLSERTAAQTAELRTLEATLTNLRSTYAALLPYASNASASLLTVIEPAVAPVDPAAPRPLLNALVAAALALLIGVGFAFLVEYLDDSIKDADAIQDAAHLGTLGTIERMAGGRGRKEFYHLAALVYPRSAAAEAFRTLRANVEFAAVDAPIRTLLVTSAVGGEGKTITAANLAIVFAQAGRRVLLVDADLRKPGVRTAFDLEEGPGLTTMLRGVDTNLASLAHQTDEPGLRILTAGPLPPNPAELLGSQRMRAVIALLEQDADLIVLDSPPVQAVTDSAVLSSFVDATLLVVDASRSRRRTVRLAREALARAGAHVLGAVLNRVPARNVTSYDYYRESGGKPSAKALAEPAKATEHPSS